MITRDYFMAAKCTNSTGYCYSAKVGSYKGFVKSNSGVFRLMAAELKQELLLIRPNGNFEVVSFNRV
jgi:hypothetical protein